MTIWNATTCITIEKSQPPSHLWLWLMDCVFLFTELTVSTYTFRLWLYLRPNGRYLIPLLVTGFPLDWRNCAHTRTENTHNCQRALPTDEPGHFSLLHLKGIRRAEMELSCNESTLWIDKSCLQSAVEGITVPFGSTVCQYFKIDAGRRRRNVSVCTLLTLSHQISHHQLLFNITIIYVPSIRLPTLSSVFFPLLFSFTLLRHSPCEFLASLFYCWNLHLCGVGGMIRRRFFFLCTFKCLSTF